MKIEGQVRIPSGCAIAAMISKEGNRMSGETITNAVNYPRPKGHGLVTAQSYERLTSPTFNPNRYCYLKWRYIKGWLTTPFVTKFTLLQLY